MVRTLLSEAANVLLTRVQPLELAEALGRRGRPPARQGPRPGRRGATAGGDHASDVDRRHAVPLDAETPPTRQYLPRNRRGELSKDMESAQADASGRTRARRHRPTFCRCRHAGGQHELSEIDASALFWPELAAAPAPTAERRMKPACRTISRERQRLEDLRQTTRLAKNVGSQIALVRELQGPKPVWSQLADQTDLGSNLLWAVNH